MRIYAANITDLTGKTDEEISALVQTLDKERQRKVSQIKHKDEQTRSITAGLLLCYSYSMHGFSQEQWDAVELEYNDYGKPSVVGADNFHYSLSHSGNWVICAVDEKNVGADIQKKQPWKLNVAKRFYSEEEYKRIGDIKEDDIERRTTLFYKMWTAKESCVKLTGRGIGKGISQFVTDEEFHHINEYFIKIYEEIADYVICVCSQGDDFPDSVEIVSLR